VEEIVNSISAKKVKAFPVVETENKYLYNGAERVILI